MIQFIKPRISYGLLALFFLTLLTFLPVTVKAQVASSIGADIEELQGYVIRRKTSIVFDGQLGPIRVFRPGVKFIGFKIRKAPATNTVIGIETPDDNGAACPTCPWDVVKDDGGSIQFTVNTGNWYTSPRLKKLPRVFRFTTDQTTGTLILELEWEEYVGRRGGVVDSTGGLDESIVY